MTLLCRWGVVWALAGLLATARGTWPCNEVGPGAQPGSVEFECPGIDSVVDGALAEAVPAVGSIDGRDVTYTEAFMEMRRLLPSLKMYLVGGPVRDALRNWSPKDIDIAISTPLSDTPTTFLGDLIARAARGGLTILRPPNTEVNMGFLLLLGRRDEGIDAISTSLNLDSSNGWRDFTVNALYYDMERRVVVDGTGLGVEDNSVKRLRMAGHEDPDGWCPLATVRGGVNCPVKIQRYVHMRVKGFLPESETRDFVVRRLTHYLDGADLGTFLQHFIFKLCKGTLSRKISHQKRAARFAKMIRALADDYAAALRPENAEIHAEYRRQMKQVLFERVVPDLMTPQEGADGDEYCWVPTDGAAILGLQCVLMDADGDTLRMPFVKEGSIDGYRFCADRRYNSIDRCVMNWEEAGVDRAREAVVASMTAGSPTCDDAITDALVRVGTMDDKTLQSMQQLATGATEFGLAKQQQWRDHVGHWTRGLAASLLTYSGVEQIARLAAQRLLLHLHEYTAFNDRRGLSLGAREVLIAGASGFVDEDGDVLWSVAEAVANGGNAREQLAMFWNVMRHDRFAEIVTDPAFRKFAYRNRMDEKRPSRCIVPRPREDPCSHERSVKALRPGWPFLSYKCPEHASKCNPIRQRASYRSTWKQFPVRGVSPAPSDRERAVCYDVRSRSMVWDVGSRMYSVTNNNEPSGYDQSQQQGFMLQAESNGFSTLAGPSGSTAWMLSFAENVLAFGPEELSLLRLALIGFLVPTEGHSIYEAMVGSDGFGMDVGRWDAAAWLSFVAELHPREAILDLQGDVVLPNGGSTAASIRGEYTQHVFTREAFVVWLEKERVPSPYAFVASFKGIRDVIRQNFDEDLVMTARARSDRSEEAHRMAQNIAKGTVAYTDCRKLLHSVAGWAQTTLVQLGGKAFWKRCKGEDSWKALLEAAKEAAASAQHERQRYLTTVLTGLADCAAPLQESLEGGYACLVRALKKIDLRASDVPSLGSTLDALGDIGAIDSANSGTCDERKKNMMKDAVDHFVRLEEVCSRDFTVSPRDLENLRDSKPFLPGREVRGFYEQVLRLAGTDGACTLPYERDMPDSESAAILGQVSASSGGDIAPAVQCQRALDARARILLSAFHRMTGLTQADKIEYGTVVEWPGFGEGEAARSAGRGVLIGGISHYEKDESIDVPVCLVRPLRAPTQEAFVVDCNTLAIAEQPEVKRDYDPTAKPDSRLVSVVGAETHWRIVDDSPICGFDRTQERARQSVARVQTVLGHRARWAAFDPLPLSAPLRWTMDTGLVAADQVQAGLLQDHGVFGGRDSLRPGQMVDCQYAPRGKPELWLPSRITEVTLAINFSTRRRWQRQMRGARREGGVDMTPAYSDYNLNIKCVPVGADTVGYDPEELPGWAHRAAAGVVRLYGPNAAEAPVTAPLGSKFEQMLQEDTIRGAVYSRGDVLWHVGRQEKVRVVGVGAELGDEDGRKHIRVLYKVESLEDDPSTTGIFQVFESYLEKIKPRVPSDPVSPGHQAHRGRPEAARRTREPVRRRDGTAEADWV